MRAWRGMRVRGRSGIGGRSRRPRVRVAVLGGRLHVDRLAFGLGAVLGGADLYAEPAAGAIIGGDLHGVGEAFELGGERFGLAAERCRRAGCPVGFEDLGHDGRVRADHRAAVALHAQVGFPDRDLQGDGPLLVAAGPGRPGAVGREGDDRELVTVAFEQRRVTRCTKSGASRARRPGRAVRVRRRPGSRPRAVRPGPRRGLDVPAHDLRAAFSPCGLHRFLDPFEREVGGQHVGELEEAGLHDGVDPTAQPEPFGHLVCVDHVQPAAAGQERLLRFARQPLPRAVGVAGSVEQHGRAGRGPLEHVEPVEKTGVVDRDEVGRAI